MKYQIFIISVLSLLASCSTKKYIAGEDWINQKAKENYEQYTIEYNEDASLALVLSTNKNEGNINFKLKFLVLDLKHKKELMQRAMDNTTVSWYSNTEILAVTQLGFVDKKTGVSQKRLIYDVLKE